MSKKRLDDLSDILKDDAEILRRLSEEDIQPSRTIVIDGLIEKTLENRYLEVVVEQLDESKDESNSDKGNLEKITLFSNESSNPPNVKVLMSLDPQNQNNDKFKKCTQSVAVENGPRFFSDSYHRPESYNKGSLGDTKTREKTFHDFPSRTISERDLQINKVLNSFHPEDHLEEEGIGQNFEKEDYQKLANLYEKIKKQ